MSTDSPASIAAVPRAARSPLTALAWHEVKRYARHPLFLAGAVLTAAVCAVTGPDPSTSSLEDMIVPAAGLGLFGLLVMISLVRSSDRASAASGGATSERDRTLALAAATVVPFAAGLLFLAWAVWAYRSHPPVAAAVPFGGVGDGWVYAMLFDLSVLAAVGGPLLGLVLARWVDFRGVGVTAVVALVLVTIVFQGIVTPLRQVRVFLPWTPFGGPYGIKGDPNRSLILTGSPQWYGVYLVAMCTLGLVVALLHDREQNRRPLIRGLVVLIAVTLVLGVLAMTMGVQHTMINPLPGRP